VQNESLARAEAELLEVNRRLEQRVEERTRELEKLAVTDSLTGIWNRREIMKHLSGEIERCLRHPHDFSIMMIDLDFFKNINDVYGHITGDLVLRKASDVFRSNCRKNDMVGRYGGEEFLVLLPDTGIDEAKVFAERIRHEIEMLVIETDQGVNVDCRCSIGVAHFDRSLSEAGFLTEADKALYRAKMSGRNCVVAANDLTGLTST
jgi:diguanylate cyclase (GGDEF)-like protein